MVIYAIGESWYSAEKTSYHILSLNFCYWIRNFKRRNRNKRWNLRCLWCRYCIIFPFWPVMKIVSYFYFIFICILMVNVIKQIKGKPIRSEYEWNNWHIFICTIRIFLDHVYCKSFRFDLIYSECWRVVKKVRMEKILTFVIR